MGTFLSLCYLFYFLLHITFLFYLPYLYFCVHNKVLYNVYFTIFGHWHALLVAM